MALKQIGQNSAEEFFETLIYMVAYDEARKMISEFTEGIENPYLKEAVDSAMNVAIFGGIFMIIQYEEQILEKVFNIASSLISTLILLPKKGLSKLRVLKGRKLSIISKIIGNLNDDAVNKANVITNQLGNFIAGRNNQYQSMNLIEGSQLIRKSVFQKEELNLRLGNAMASRYNETLIFKLLTSSFSANDKTILKKILGTYDPDKIDVNDLNKIASFMFVKDDEGKIVGLSQAFLELVNGLGYIK